MSVPLYRDEEMPVFTLAPNWQSASTLTIREDTSIVEALDQSEERWQHYPRPLYGIRFDATAMDSRQQASFRKLFELAEAKPFGMPLWTEAVELAEAADEGAENLTVSSMDGTLFTALSYLILWADADTWEVLRYSGVTFVDSIPLTQATTRAWPAGTKVVPVAWGYCKRPDFTALGADNSHLAIDFEERILFGSDREGDYWAPITPEVEYTPCYDEIVVTWGSLPATVENIEITHAATEDGPWLWWGETRQRTSGVTLSNYFKTRWLRIRALTTDGAIVLKTFQPTPPAVDPPTVEVYERNEDQTKAERVLAGVGNKPDDYTGSRPSSPFGTDKQLPYGGGYAGADIYDGEDIVPATARDRIAAVYTGNLIDPASGIRMYKLNLFSDAFVELQWRYIPTSTWERGARFGKLYDIVAESSQDGATVKWTLDGTDPSESNGYDSDDAIYPHPNIFLWSDFVPYIIARCFKDGCKSPPIYVPIDLVYHSDILANPRQGHGSIRYPCPVYFHDAECNQYPPEGDGSAMPCTDVDLGAYRAEAILEAASGFTDYFPQRTLRNFLGETDPRWTCAAHEGETCWGTEPEGCTVELWGGGSWRMDCDLFCVNIIREDSFVWIYDSDAWGSILDDVFVLLDGTITATVEGIPTEVTIPALPSDREQVEGLQMATPDLAAKLKSTMAAGWPNAFIMPADGSHDELDDVRLTISCAAF